MILFSFSFFFLSIPDDKKFPANIINNEKTRKRCEICSKLTIKITKRRLCNVIIPFSEGIIHVSSPPGKWKLTSEGERRYIKSNTHLNTLSRRTPHVNDWNFQDISPILTACFLLVKGSSKMTFAYLTLAYLILGKHLYLEAVIWTCSVKKEFLKIS